MKRQTLFAGVLILGLTLISVPSPRVVDAARSADFDGDWYADLAVGVRYEGVGSASLAGAVNGGTEEGSRRDLDRPIGAQ